MKFALRALGPMLGIVTATGPDWSEASRRGGQRRGEVVRPGLARGDGCGGRSAGVALDALLPRRNAMSIKRRVGQEHATSEGVDEPASGHVGVGHTAPGGHDDDPPAAAERSPDGALRADAIAVDGARSRGAATAADGTPAPPDPSELDRRDRMQSAKRKAAGPTKTPTAAARPRAPASDATPPSDPA